ncbi:MAG: ABC transporter permease [Candidatus Dormibacteria bacterium]
MSSARLRPLGLVSYNLTVYRRTWLNGVIISFVAPLLFLAGMGLGLGRLVGRNTGLVGGVSYLSFIAPGLLVATAMQTAAFETSFPILGKIMWMRIYEAVLSTPLTVSDVLVGEVVWLALRCTLVATIFTAVIAAFGVAHSALVVLSIPVAVLTGLAFGIPIMAYAATQRRDAGCAAINRFIILPLFLVSGTFFPIDRLPGPVRAVAWSTPLAHGVALARGLTLGSLRTGAALAHLAVLALYIGGGLLAARWTLTRRLVR